MKVVIDIETDRLIDPQHIWCIVCKDIDQNTYTIFRNVTENNDERERFLRYIERLGSDSNSLLIGHNILNFDYPVLDKFFELHTKVVPALCLDTLIVSKLADYSREGGHSIEAYGQHLLLPKITFSDFSQWSQEMENYCVRDVDICHRIYDRYLPFIQVCHDPIDLEQLFQYVTVNGLERNGFGFNPKKAGELLKKVEGELDGIDQEIQTSFPRKLHPIREIVPKLTRWGTLNKSDFRWIQDGDLTPYSAGAAFTRCEWVNFNPQSHRQIIDVLHQAGWSPTVRTKAAIEAERSARREIDPAILQSLAIKRVHLEKYGWKVNEENLSTLPTTAPKPARLLARRILLESRRRTLVEWLGLCRSGDRIHGKFYGIGAWTHRMAHQEPNTANIPNEYHENNTVKLYGKEMRSLWCAPKNRLLVGVDAEGIQLRIFAHYIDDKEFTESLVNGDKNAGTDPHSLNKRILGVVCKSRQAAKRFIYALLLGAGITKLAEILECSKREADDALHRIMERYEGFNTLKRTVIPADGRRGWFLGLDGRRVTIPGETAGDKRHLCMSGYLQNGEAIIIKKAATLFEPQLQQYQSFLVGIIHDEYQLEVPNNMDIAIQVAEIVSQSITQAGEYYKLRCPMKGSYWSDRHKDYSIGKNWWQTH